MTVAERRQRERAHRRQVIIAAARDLAEAEGWAAVTTRRLADLIEYSQPVLYSHFDNKDAIVEAVAVEGFDQLAVILGNARESGKKPEAALRHSAQAYLDFARMNPAVYDAMFTLATNLPFGQPEAPTSLHDAFAQLQEAVQPLAGSRDASALTEVVWSALHGLATLARTGRLRPDAHEQRLTLLVDRLTGHTHVPVARAKPRG